MAGSSNPNMPWLVKALFGEYSPSWPRFLFFYDRGHSRPSLLHPFLAVCKRGSGRKKSLLALNPQGRLQMIWVLIALVVYAIGMNYVGFFFSTIIFLVALLRGIGRQGWGVSVATSSIGAIGFHFIFQYWLDVQMPRGIFGF